MSTSRSHRSHRSHRRLSRLVAATALLLASTLLASCGGGSDVTASIVSDERPASDETSADDVPASTDEIADFCDRAAELQVSDADSSDPAAQLEALESLREVAPAELEKAFDVLADVIAQMSELDETDPEAMGEMFAILLDPRVVEASAAISSFTMRECGFEMTAGAGTDSFDGNSNDTSGEAGGGVGGFDDDPMTLRLDDVEAIEDAAVGQTWPGKLNSTLISNGVDVELAADSSDPITPDEALAACTALWQGLSPKNPAVTVTILNGEKAVAASGADGTCTQS